MSTSVKSTTKRTVDPHVLKKAGVEAGVLTGSASGAAGPSLVEIAIWNEFGTERKVPNPDGGETKTVRIPERPFIRSTNEEKRREWQETLKRVNRLVLAGTITVDRAVGILGAQMQADIQQKIVDLRTPANADSTIKRKGSDNPLIDEGHLKDSIKWDSYNE